MLDDLLRTFVNLTRPLGLNYSFVLDASERSAFLHGLVVTLEICLWTIPCSILAGVVIASALTSGKPRLARIASGFVEITRNTPTLVQLYCAFLVLNMLITQNLKGIAPNPMTPFLWVVIVISLHKGVFHAEALRAGIEAVPRVTLDAAKLLGFSRFQELVEIQLPIAFRFALPALVNNMVDLVKMTALASAIAVGDVTYESIMIWSHRDNVLELLLLILLYFGLLTWLVSVAGRWLERRYRIPGYGQ